MYLRLIPYLGILVGMISYGSCVGASEFLRLGILPTYTSSFGRDISSDGGTVVGLSSRVGRQEAFRWTRSTGMQSLGDLPGDAFLSAALAVTADGSVVVGGSASARVGGEDAFRWSQGTGIEPVQNTIGDTYLKRATGVSDDGAVIVGLTEARTGNGCSSCIGRWTPETALEVLDDPRGNGFSIANDVSADGRFLVGTAGEGVFGEAFRWSRDEGFVWLDGNFGIGPQSESIAISGDGRVVVGRIIQPGTFDAFRWSGSTGIQILGHLPGGEFISSQATAVSKDGSVVLGTSSRAVGQEAFVWDQVNGMQKLRDVLITEYGLSDPLQGWLLNGIRGISADRKAIAGTVVHTTGRQEAFVAYLDFPLGSGPPTLLGDYNNNGAVEQGDLDLVLLNWGRMASPPPAGWTHDLPSELIDQDELDRVLLGWGNTTVPQNTTVASAVPEPPAVPVFSVFFILVLAYVREQQSAGKMAGSTQ